MESNNLRPTVLALANVFGEEYVNHPLTAELYAIAEPLFKNLEDCFRIFP